MRSVHVSVERLYETVLLMADIALELSLLSVLVVHLCETLCRHQSKFGFLGTPSFRGRSRSSPLGRGRRRFAKAQIDQFSLGRRELLDDKHLGGRWVRRSNKLLDRYGNVVVIFIRPFLLLPVRTHLFQNHLILCQRRRFSVGLQVLLVSALNLHGLGQEIECSVELFDTRAANLLWQSVIRKNDALREHLDDFIDGVYLPRITLQDGSAFENVPEVVVLV